MCGLFTSTTTRTESKMDALQQEMTGFVDHIHEDGRCLGAVSTFDDDVSTGQMHQSASTVKDEVETITPNGKTALYDSLVASMVGWQRARIEADRTHVPALLVTVTDGKENASNASLGDVREAIRETGFHPENQCYFVIVGVGDDVSEQELREICEGGHGVYEHVDDVDEVMKLVIAATLVGIVRQERYQKIEQKAESVDIKELRRDLAAIGLSKLDYMLNIDASGSMSNST